MARRLRMAAGDDRLPDHEVLVRMIRRWEHKNAGVSERYELLYRQAIDAESSRKDRSATTPFDAAGTRKRLAPYGLPPSIGLDELRHVAAALEDARRYMDADVVMYFSERIASLAADDGKRGPRCTLPPVLGVIAAVEHCARQVRPAVRRDLLAVGARAAEFAGWLYRDIGSPGEAAYWRDRATEWAQEGGHHILQGYVVLRKSQAAWDERDAIRMLTLAQAAQDGIWCLPARVRAEAAQQEARAHAMLGEGLREMESKLDEAHALMDLPADDSEIRLGVSYARSLLAIQTAMCYMEAGCPVQAVEIYDGELTEDAFSRRDYGYFRALMAEAQAAAGEPAGACASGMKALLIAQETSSTRTITELVRVARRLDPWRCNSDVRAFQDYLEAV